MFKHVTIRVLATLTLGCLLAGCGSPGPETERAAEKPAANKKTRSRRPGADRSPAKRPTAGRQPGSAPGDDRSPDAVAPVAEASDTAAEPGEEGGEKAQAKPRRTLGDLLERPADSASRWIPNLPRMKVDQARVAAAGIRKLAGRRLTLYTDMPPSEEIDRLPEVFDRAFPQWCDYFNVAPSDHADWKMTGFLMKEKARFQRAGLLPGDLPDFQNGYARNHELWLYDQPSDYYRRHLLLHEGTHGFMNTLLGGCGPPWYMEGIAELLATHRWAEGRLTLNYMPGNRAEVPQWGRIRIIKDAFSSGRAERLQKVIDYPPHAHLETAPYAWCWAAATLMDHHPRYRQRFRTLYKQVLADDFNQRFMRLFGDDWRQLCEEWRVLVGGLEYGHDVAATAIDFSPGRPLPSGGATVDVSAAKGWQNSGLRLDGGVEYRLRAAGRYQVADRPQIWWCEPGGVSLRYYRGRPLGILLAAVRPDDKQSLALLRPTPVGLAATLTPEQTGTLYLKINDSAAELGDNAAGLKVTVETRK